jgi:hypothetical protein
MATATTNATGSVTLSININRTKAKPLAMAGSSTLCAALARAIR